ncbi:hypothetical protein [Actinomadura bangladeshensis]|uniref:hypothetical protein n=1 Tax=Actinomadura bangladeshensis TaxID=453573 RepID=UPI0031DBDE71
MMVSLGFWLRELASKQPDIAEVVSMPPAALAPERPALVLEPTDRAPAKARRYLTVRFAELGHADDFFGRLVVTELVTNSCAPRGALSYPRLSREELKGGFWV